MELANKIGFNNKPFPVKENSLYNTKVYKMRCRNFNVDVEVSKCKLLSGNIEFTGIVTNRVSISHKLIANGFGSSCHIDEMNTMFEAVKLYCQEHDVRLGGQYNNWPSFRGSLI